MGNNDFLDDMAGIKDGNSFLDKISGITAAPAPPQEKGFLSNVGDALSKRVSNIQDEWSTPDKGLVGTAERNLRTGGQIAGMAGDILGEGVKSLYKTIVPESVQGAISSGAKAVAETPVGQMGINAAKEGYNAYQVFKKSFPDAAKDLEATVNIASLIPMGAGAKVAGEGVNIGRDVVASAIQKTPQAIEQGLNETIKKGIEKGVRPSVVGKQSIGQVDKYFANANDAVKNIISNKQNLSFVDKYGEPKVSQLPGSLHEFSQAIDQTKKGIFDRYNQMAIQAGEKEAEVGLEPIVKALQDASASKKLLDHDPTIAKYAGDYAERLAERGKYSTTEAQDIIKTLNNGLQSFYKNPTYDSASKAYIDALVADNLRKGLDGVIESSVGKGYGDLKRSYGALKGLEKDVNHRAIVDARKNIKGLADLTDPFSNSEIIGGILSANPGMVAKGTAWRGFKEYIKFKNDPNHIVKKMFTSAEKQIGNKGFEPKSKLYKGMMPPPPPPDIPPGTPPDIRGMVDRFNKI